MTDLATSYYAGFKPEMGAPVRTSVGTPKWWRGELEHIRRITPYGVFGIEDPDEYKAAYVARLDRIDVADLAQRFEEISAKHGGRPLVLLCFESLTKPDQWCHRRIAADWLEEHGFGPVPEARR
jgi:hypothetical protein